MAEHRIGKLRVEVEGEKVTIWMSAGSGFTLRADTLREIVATLPPLSSEQGDAPKSKPRRPALAILRDRWRFRVDHMAAGPERSAWRAVLAEIDAELMDNVTGALEQIAAEEATPSPAQGDTDALRTALGVAIDLAEEGWSYASNYFRQKWGLAERLAELRAVLEPSPAQESGTAGGPDRIDRAAAVLAPPLPEREPALTQEIHRRANEVEAILSGAPSTGEEPRRG
jgi:hypothetical protein